MKRYCKSFKITKEFIIDSILECLKRKWKRKDVAYFLATYVSKDTYMASKKIRKHILTYGNKEIIDNLIPLIADDIFEEINTRQVKFAPIEWQIRQDKSNYKFREIGIASI